MREGGGWGWRLNIDGTCVFAPLYDMIAGEPRLIDSVQFAVGKFSMCESILDIEN